MTAPESASYIVFRASVSSDLMALYKCCYYYY